MQLNHLLVLAADMCAMRDFFVDVIGLEDGPRPPFSFPGHWLYSEGEALIHLAQGGDDVERENYLGNAVRGGAGPIDHLALTGAAPGALLDRLRRADADYMVRHVPAENHMQIFIRGPEGVKVEMLFPQAPVLQSCTGDR